MSPSSPTETQALNTHLIRLVKCLETTRTQKCFWCRSFCFSSDPGRPPHLNNRDPGLALVLGAAVRAQWVWTKSHVLWRMVGWPELLLSGRVTPCRLQSQHSGEKQLMLLKRHVSQRLQVTWLWPLQLNEEGHLTGWAWGPMLGEGWGRPSGNVRVNHKNEAIKGQDSCSHPQGQTERAGPLKWVEWAGGDQLWSTTEPRNVVGG